MKKGTTNLQLRKLTDLLRKKRKGIWLKVAEDLTKPARARKVVNIFRINRFSTNGETIVIPGKVLGDGTLEHSVTVAAFSFSKEAKSKIEKAGGKVLSINELVRKHPDGKGVKILG